MNIIDNLPQELHNIGAIKHGNFTLKSGLSSPIYINLRCLISYPQLLQKVAEALWKKISHLEFDYVCGVPYTALPIATCMSVAHNKPMLLRRKEVKQHGLKQLIDGIFEEEGRCIVVEDVLTTGASILETVNDLRAAGLQVSHVVAVLDRQQGGRETLQKEGLNVYCLHTLDELL